MNLLYIGAGCDFSILKSNLKVDIYLFVDSQPRSEFGTLNNSALERPDFIKSVKKELSVLGYKKIKRYEFRAICKAGKKYHCDGVILFRSKDYSKFLYYFYSTTFPPTQNDHPLYQFINTCNILFVKGHEPETDVVKLMNKPITFIASECCVYKKDDTKGLFSSIDEESESIKQWYMLMKNGEIQKSSYNDIFSAEQFGFEENEQIKS